MGNRQPSIDPRDQGLIDSFLAGEESAVASVRQWLEQASVSYRRRLGWEWEDLCQDLLLEVTRLFSTGAFAGRSSLRTYIWRVTNYACLTRLHRDRNQRQQPLETASEVALATDASALDEMMSRESTDALLRLMARMSNECRRLWTQIFEGLSYTEMSARFGVSVGTLRVRVHRCRRRALSLWQEGVGGGVRAVAGTGEDSGEVTHAPS